MDRLQRVGPVPGGGDAGPVRLVQCLPVLRPRRTAVYRRHGADPRRLLRPAGCWSSTRWRGARGSPWSPGPSSRNAFPAPGALGLGSVCLGILLLGLRGVRRPAAPACWPSSSGSRSHPTQWWTRSASARSCTLRAWRRSWASSWPRSSCCATGRNVGRRGGTTSGPACESASARCTLSSPPSGRPTPATSSPHESEERLSGVDGLDFLFVVLRLQVNPVQLKLNHSLRW